MSALPKPRHLEADYASQFQDTSVVQAYHHRPPYPAATFDILLELIAGKPRSVLDAGCGTGEIARPLAPHVGRVDAVDVSAGMIEKGKRLPGGDHPAIRWLLGRVEDVELKGPYGLVAAASSLHWMDWQVVMPRFREVLAPGGHVAVVYVHRLPLPWDDALQTIITRYSTNRDYRPYSLVDELQQRDLFQKQGERRTAPVTFTQPINQYIEAFHAMNGLSRDRMAGGEAAAFDAEVRQLVLDYCENGRVTLRLCGVVSWGSPAGARRGD
jgi:ubiquinone/menaquinone biosynthesis C-methylase UbiE